MSKHPTGKRLDVTSRGLYARGQLKLALEPLECRRLLAGINVSVLIDSAQTNPDSNGLAAVSRLVYLDANRNETYDSGEQIRITDADGNASFDDLEPGDYSVGLLANSASQHQTSPSRVAPSSTLLSDAGGQYVLSNSDATTVWTLDDSGEFHSAVGAEPESTKYSLDGGIPKFVEQTDSSAIIVASHGDTQKVWHFDIATGQVNQLGTSGLPQDAQITGWTTTRDGFAALFSVGGQNLIALGTLEGNNVGFSVPVSTQATKIAGSGGSSLVFALTSPDQTHDNLVRLNPVSGLADSQPRVIEGEVTDLVVDATGARAVVVLSEGGAEVIEAGGDSLVLSALLAEATGPIEFSGNDGRVITGDSQDAARIIVWDATTWQPYGRSEIANAGSAALAGLHRVANGELLVANPNGLHKAALDDAANAPVSLPEESQVQVQFRVDVDDRNTPPTAGDVNDRVIEEDTIDLWDLSDETSFSDADGDLLWYSIGTPPEHGELSLEPDGSWQYEPADNYFGGDSATIWLYDGIDSTEISIHLIVEPVNDLPERLYFDIPEVAENASVGDLLGYVSIVDVDRDAVYHVTTSDPRLEVTEGRVYLASGWLDFETDPELPVEFVATDASDQRIQISTTTTLAIADVNEPPTDITVDGNQIPENEPGAEVGEVVVIDEDAYQEFQIDVSDDRFEVVDGILKLFDGQELDRETEPEVTVEVVATDVENPEHVISTTVTVQVANRNDPPGELTLSRHEVESKVRGASVGNLQVADPDGDRFEFSVADARFEVDGSTLKLRANISLDSEVDPTVQVGVTATAASGDRVTELFEIQVLEYSNFQNPFLNYDVNGDGLVTPLDVLILVNLLNRQGYQLGGSTSGGGAGEPENALYPDVNGDNRLSPIDVLLIVNYLNGHRDSFSGEGEWSLPIVAQQSDVVYGPQLADEFDRDKAERDDQLRRDIELERLLTELSLTR